MVSFTAKKIKKLRADRGLSQKALAELLGCSQSAVSEWERGKSMPSDEHIEALLNVFHIVTESQVKESAPTPEPRTEEPEPVLWLGYLMVFGVFLYMVLTITGQI